MKNYKPLSINTLRNNTTLSFTVCSTYISVSTTLPKIARFINKYLYGVPFLGIGASLDRYTNNFTIYSAHQDRKRYSKYKDNAIFANFGCGAFSHNKWTNFDYPGISKYYKSLLGKPNKDFIPIDLTEKNLRIPFADSTVDLIYFSHVLEHLGEEAGTRLFKEFNRVLKNNGIIRLVLPFTDRFVYTSSVINMQENISEKEKEVSTSASIKETLSDAPKLNSSELLSIARLCNYDIKEIQNILKDKIDNLFTFDKDAPGRHIVHWNESNLIELSRKTGFKKTYPLLRGHSFAEPFENLCTFDTSEPQISIYFEIKK